MYLYVCNSIYVCNSKYVYSCLAILKLYCHNGNNDDHVCIHIYICLYILCILYNVYTYICISIYNIYKYYEKCICIYIL